MILPILQIVRGPFLLDRTVGRVVELNDGSGRLEVWDRGANRWTAGADWEDAAGAPAASPDVLTDLGIPPEDW